MSGEQDIAAELRHWADQGTAPPLQLLRRAISEIETLRKRLAEQDLIVRAAIAERIAFHTRDKQ